MEYHVATNRIVLLVDLLDECEKMKDILDFFLQLRQVIPEANILITSRDDPDISQRLQSFSRVRLESYTSEISRDIHQYIDARLETDDRLRWLSPRVKCDITQSLDQKSSGM